MADSLLSSTLIINGTLTKKPGSLIGIISKDASIEYYQGEYEFTPSSEEQVIATKSKFLSENIIIKPVPPTFGRIEWNGSYLTVY